MTDNPHTPTDWRATMREIEHVTYFAVGVTRTFCTACTWSVATEHRSLNIQAFEKHICKESRNETH